MQLDLSFLSAYVDPFILSQAIAFAQVVFIDIVMAGDNAIAVGLAAAGLPPDKRKKAIFYGLIGAFVTRIGFVIITVELLKVVGLLLAGGLLLLWVCWKMWREMNLPSEHEHAVSPEAAAMAAGKGKARTRTLGTAVLQILIADISMSLDNVLAVSGAAANHVWVLAFGLIFSIAAMAFLANIIAKILHKFRWIGYAGVAVVLFVACKMIWEGGNEVWEVGKCDLTFKCLPELYAQFVAWVQGLAKLIPAAK